MNSARHAFRILAVMEGVAMQRTFRLVITGILGSGLLLTQSPSSAEVDLKTAQRKAEVEGDLKGAIKQYAAVVAKYKADRGVTAMALVRMAECYQKMGDAEAQKIYELVITNYADQKESALIARFRLGATTAKRGDAISSRRIWTFPQGADSYGQVSPDGRYIPYTNWSDNGNLFLHDVISGTERRLTDSADDRFGGSGAFAEEAAFSRDCKQLAYTWEAGKNAGVELRVISLQGTGVPQPRRLVVNQDLKWISPYSWSPAGNSIAVFLQRKDRSAQLALVSVEDGSLHVIKSVEWRFPAAVFFSPDGKYLAYDTPAGDSSGQRDVFVIAADGSREIPAVVGPSRESVVGWSPDGKHLIFASDRSGSMGLWALPFSEGKPQGPAQLLKSDFGEPTVLGITSSGALYSAAYNPGGVTPDLNIATFDFVEGKFLSKPAQAARSFLGTNFLPSWSPDGKYLAYASIRGSHVAIGIRSLETGQIRELVPTPNFTPSRGYFWWLTWAPDGNSFIVGAQGDKHGFGVFRIDAHTGATSFLVQSSRPRWAMLSPDGNSLYYMTADRTVNSDGLPSADGYVFVVRRNLASGQEQELTRQKYMPPLAGVNLSRDGRHIVIGPIAGSGTVAIIPTAGGPPREVTQHGTLTFANFSPDARYLTARVIDPNEKSNAVLLIPVDGGEPREVMRGPESELVSPAAWAPDSRSIVLKKSSPGTAQPEFWRVPLDGTGPKKLDVSVEQMAGGFYPSPDGTHTAFWSAPSPKKPAEIWVTENFLPASNARN
jgi:Tol biopolymer transport system component